MGILTWKFLMYATEILTQQTTALSMLIGYAHQVTQHYMWYSDMHTRYTYNTIILLLTYPRQIIHHYACYLDKHTTLYMFMYGTEIYTPTNTALCMLFRYPNHIIQRYMLLRHNVTYSFVSYLNVWKQSHVLCSEAYAKVWTDASHVVIRCINTWDM
jgi:hypothetical protein